ncbi:MAG: hypothetical protein NT124_02240, partial [Candidatus Dependentiae bacterium]|nr:hypothetical protein [Candidatus Dependentiae bacterium]
MNMKIIKQMMIVTALLTSLGPVVNVQAGVGSSRLAVDPLKEANEALLTAARSGNLNDGIKAVVAGASVDKATQEGCTPLLMASH